MKLYEVTPLVCQAHTEQVIEIRPLYSHVAFDRETYEIVSTAMETHEMEVLATQVRNGSLKFKLKFGREQEYSISVNGLRFSVYCLDREFYGKKPYKGDFHIHSNRSDGREDPAFVTVSARSIGMDFVAVTDHGQYQPSLEAIECLEGFESDFLVLPGEEIHPPGNPVHMINFGGSHSVNEMFGEQYKRDIESSGPFYPLDADRSKIYSSCEWCFRKISEVGGISILCHPYWITSENRYSIESALLDYLMEKKPFTAFELIGGHDVESNVLQTAYYNQKRAAGTNIPVVGVSDAHSTIGGDYFGWSYTVILAKDLTREGIREAVENNLSVAVESLPGEATRMYGDFRLVKYFMFLHRTYFPQHDEECRREGAEMYKFIQERAARVHAIDRKGVEIVR